MPKRSGDVRLNINLEAGHGFRLLALDSTQSLLAEMAVNPDRVSVNAGPEGVRISIGVTAPEMTASLILSKVLSLAYERDLFIDEICISDVPARELQPF